MNIKIKKVILVNTIFILFVTFTGCSKERQTLKDNTWEVESMKVHADADLMYPPYPVIGPIILSFPKMGRYHLRLEFNTCEGRGSIIGSKISFKPATCTLINMSSFATSFDKMLQNNINRYTINGNNLVLEGDNGERINFVKQ